MPYRWLLLCGSLFFSANVAAADDGLFAKDVAPLLQKRCVGCHNPDKRQGGLNLTTREKMLRGGDNGPAIKPSDAARSLLLEVVSGPDARMPKQGDKLTEKEIATLRQWIDAGADWPKGVVLAADKKPAADGNWWSLQPIARPALPDVKDKEWGRAPIDAFILAKLEAKGLKPSEPADRRTLLRRVTYDLHGLPPTPDEVDAFVNDKAPDAYDKVLDRLLASPRYGERWGRFWLDVVHYGDTHGYDKDKRRDYAWPYRDYVVRSFNDDKPYSRFIKEQLAGDVLYPDDPDGTIATGFIAAGPWDFVGQVELREGTVDKEKTRLLDRDDMVSNTCSTFLSVTAHCARCHDHKFDPIPQQDYYRLQAVFAGVERGDRSYPRKEQLAEKTKLEEERTLLVQRWQTLQERIDELKTPEYRKLTDKLANQRAELAGLPRPVGDKLSPTNGYHSAIEPKPDTTKWVQVDLGRSLPLDEIRLIPARPTDFADTPGFGFPLRFRVEVSDDATFAKARTVLDQTAADVPNIGDALVPIPLKDQTARYVRVTATRLWKRTNDYVFALAELEVDSGGKNVAAGAKVTALDSIEAGRWGVKNLVDGFDSRHGLVDHADPKIDKQRRELVQQIQAKEAARQQMLDGLLDEPLRKAVAEADAGLRAVENKLQALAGPGQVYAARSIAPRPIYLLKRGDVEQRGDKVTAGGLSCIKLLDPNFKESDQEGPRRAALANWIAHRDNPLTWRSIVNRVWQTHFGRGLVDTPSDFGRNGSLPTHPELLDWLAIEFRDHGGSFKKLHRTILLSNTYRQMSANNTAFAKIDADNRYLWRQNRVRLDAESVRDSLLAISGKLDLQMGGPGFELFRFKDDHSPIYDHTALEKINDPATFRRTVYRFTVRSVPNPFLDSLDCADPNINTPVRNTTLTALQALALLNDPFLFKQAEYFAERVHKVGDDVGKQIDLAYQLAYGRLPDAAERELLVSYVKKHGLVQACRVLLNANEFVFID